MGHRLAISCLACIAAVSVLACDDGTSTATDDVATDEHHDIDTAPPSDTGDTTAPLTVERLELPLVPVGRAGLPFQGPVELDESGTVPVLRADLWTTVAVGEGYPTSMTIELATTAFTLCGALEGQFVVETVAPSPTSQGVALQRAADDEIGVLVDAVGVGAATVRGTFTATAASPCAAVPVGEPIEIELGLVVDARRIDRVEVDAPFACDDDSLIVAVGARPGLQLRLLDDAGRTFYPLNAMPGREADLVIEADSPFVPPPLDEGLDDLVMPTRAATVTLTPVPGSPTDVRVVDADAATGAEVEFVVAGYAAGPTSLVSGEHYDTFGARKANRIVPIVASVDVDGAVLCGGPAHEWFTLTSATPEVCDVRPIAADSLDTLDSLVIPDGHVDQSAYLHADGRCRLTLRADGFAAGTGLEATLDATFADVALLSDVP